MTVRSWKINGLTVECTLDAVQQISAAARDGFMRFPHGGLEVGGLLIGEGRGDVLRIVGTKPLPIEYARGASFILTEADEAALRTMIAETPDVAGWYVSHTRRGAVLTDRDKLTYDEFFGDAGQVCAIIKPAVDGAETWALFVRDASGAVLPAGAFQDVEADAWAALARGVAATAIATTAAEPRVEAPPEAVVVERTIEQPDPRVVPIQPRIEPAPRIVQQPQPAGRRNWTRPAAVACVLLAFTGGAWYISSSRAVQSAQQQTPAISGERNRVTPAAATPAPAPAQQVAPSAETSAAIENPAASKKTTRSKHARRVRARGRHRR